mmetsp:Transcript_63773/g.137212  ORF Transcript_63773/g.137212 Transcript_63773/m.137212 type:complete len:1495 (+) Transcript_63773:66-4550(+)
MLFQLGTVFLNLVVVTWAKEIINIVHFAAITGGWPGGSAMNEGARLLALKINANPAILPNYDLMLKPVDTMCSKIAEQKMYTLLFEGVADVYTYDSVHNFTIASEHLGIVGATDYVGIIGTSCAGGTMTITKLAATARKPMVSPGARNPALSDRAAHPYFWRTTNSMATEVGRYASVAKLLGLSKVGVFMDSVAEGYATMIIDTLISNDVEMVGPTLVSQPTSASWGVAQANSGTAKGFVMNGDSMIQANSFAQIFLGEPARMVFMRFTAERPIRMTLCALYNAGLRGFIPIVSGSYQKYHHMSDNTLATEGTDCIATDFVEMAQGSLFVGSYQVRTDRGVAPALAPCYSMDPLSFWDEFLAAVTDADGNLAKGYVYGSPTADALCMWALALHEMIEIRGVPLSAMQNMNTSVFQDTQSLFGQTSFEGLTGKLQFVNQGDVTGLPGPDSFGIQYLKQLRSVSYSLGQFASEYLVVAVIKSVNNQVVFYFEPDATLTFAWDSKVLNTSGTDLVSSLSDYPTCQSGTMYNYTNKICVGCVLGTSFDSVVGTCRSCASGFYGLSDTTGMPVCKACAPGTYQDSQGRTVCMECVVGTSAAESQMTHCIECQSGKYADVKGLAQCEYCQQGRYTQFAGNSTCTPCPGGLTNLVKGSTSAEDCACSEGSYLPVGGSSCTPCPEGMSCAFGSDANNFLTGMFNASTTQLAVPMVNKGYFTKSTEPLSVYKCFSSKGCACPGSLPQTCEGTREGLLCSKCPAGEQPNDCACEECGSGAAVLPILLCVLLILGCLIGGYIIMDKEERMKQNSSTLLAGMVGSQSVAALQSINVLGNIATSWPEPFKSLLSFLSIFNFNLTILNLNCLGQVSATSRYAIRVLAIFAMLAMLCPIHVVRVFVSHEGHFSQHWPTLISVAGVVFMVFYLSIANAVFTPFRCYSHPNGQSTLRDFQTVLCWDSTDGDHTSMVVIACFGSLIPVSFICGCAFVVWRFPMQMRLKNVRFLYMFRFLFFRYIPSAYWYSIVLLIRNFLMAVATIIPNVTGQIVMIYFIMMPSLVVVLLKLPWNNKLANAMETACIVAITTILLFSIFFVDVPVDTTTLSSLCCVVFSIIVLGFLGVAGNAIYQRVVMRGSRPFGHFLCHHKAGAGSFARLMKMHLVEHPKVRKKVWIDCDDLQDLTLLFGYVGSYSDQVIALCSKEFLSRPWCVGELTTARVNNVPVALILFPDFDFPNENFIHDYAVYVPSVSDLTPHGIALEEAQTTLSWIESNNASQLPEFKDDIMAVLCDNIATNHMEREPRATSRVEQRSSGAVIIADHSFTEVLATAYIIERLLLKELQTDLSKVPHVQRPDQRLRSEVKRAIIFCSNGCFVNRSNLDHLFQAAEMELIVLPIIVEESFRFPTASMFMTLERDVELILKSAGSPYSARQIIIIIKRVFQEIAIVVQPADYSSTAELLAIRGATTAKRLWDGTNKLTKPGAPGKVEEEVMEEHRQRNAAILTMNV